MAGEATARSARTLQKFQKNPILSRRSVSAPTQECRHASPNYHERTAEYEPKSRSHVILSRRASANYRLMARIAVATPMITAVIGIIHRSVVTSIAQAIPRSRPGNRIAASGYGANSTTNEATSHADLTGRRHNAFSARISARMAATTIHVKMRRRLPTGPCGTLRSPKSVWP